MEPNPSLKRKIRVLVVDDSALVRQLLTTILNAASDIEVVGSAGDPYIARRKIKELHPDVLTLDVEMPRMDGITFLRNLMRLHPMPVVMVSSLTQKGAEVTLEALELGAVDFVPKPRVDISHQLQEYAEEIIQKVRAAARARIRPPLSFKPVSGPRANRHAHRRWRGTWPLVAMGASTGGTEAIKAILAALPPDGPPTVITLHIPEAFSGSFARRMNEVSPMRVCEAEDGQPVLPGHVYIAPGSQHLIVRRDGSRWRCRLRSTPPVNRHRPSVDVLFHSVAEQAGPDAMGVLLTGMGRDGAAGLLEMRRRGAYTLVQDESTSVVWGMPGAAVEMGAACEVLPLEKIVPRILDLCQQRGPQLQGIQEFPGKAMDNGGSEENL